MHPVIQELLAQRPVLTDGAWGTQLQQRGLPIGACPEAWNLSHPEEVEGVARAYVDAGSRVIITNTFGGNRIALARHGLDDRCLEINRAGVEISRRAAGDRAKVFATMGPTGKMILSGEVSSDELREVFNEQARAMADAGADAVVIETMSETDEIESAVKAVIQVGLPVVACMVFDSGKDLDRTLMGIAPEEVAEKLCGVGADVIGANCGQGIEGFVSLCRRLRKGTSRPLWIKANAGMPEIVDGQAVYRQTPEQFASFIPQLVDAGADFIGGCCGTTPEFIQAAAKKLPS